MRTDRGDRPKRPLRDRVLCLPLPWAAPLLVFVATALVLATGIWPAGERASTAAAADQARTAARHPGGPVNFSREDPRATELGRRAARRAAERRQVRLATPAFREERTRSRTAYRGADAAVALRIARRRQPEVAVRPLWRGPAVEQDEKIVSYSSPVSALVESEGSDERSRVEAIGAPFAVGPKPGEPAAAKDLRAIDLNLEADDQGWRPERASVATTLPRDTGGVVTVGDDLALDLRQEDEREDSVGTRTGGTKVFYGGVTADTDAVVESVADGVSLSWLLRSPTAPTRLRFHVRGGAPKDRETNPDGSLTLYDDDREIGTVSAPRAADAQDTPVGARFVVDGEDVWVEVDHRGRDLAYPIAVDPVIRPSGGLAALLEQDDTTTPAPGPQRSGWVPHTFQPAALQFQELGSSRSITATGQGPGSGWFSFNPIRNSAAYKVQYTDVRLAKPSTSGFEACQNVGIYVEVAPNTAGSATAKHAYWLGNYTAGGATPWNSAAPPAPTAEGPGTYSNCTAGRPAAFVEVCAADDCKPIAARDNATAAQLNTSGNVPATATFTGAYVFHREDVPPTATATTDWDATKWRSFKNGANVRVVAHDDGVGLCGDAAAGFPPVVTVNDVLPAQRLGQAGNSGCTGMTYDRPAPSDQTYDVVIPPGTVKEGIRVLAANVVDAVNNSRSVGLAARSDQTGPQLALSGDLYVQRQSAMVADGRRPLTVAATDGTGTALADARAGVQRIQVYVDGALAHTAEQTAVGDSKPLTATWTPGPGTFADGSYEVRVVGTDRAGNASSERFTVTAGTSRPPRADEPGLGFEDWQTYDSTDTGAGSVHRVNLSTGNSLWSVTPVSNPGLGFDTSLRLTYNSLEPSALRPDLATYKPFAYGVAGRGVSVQLGSITRLNEPLWIENGNGGPSVSGSSSGVDRIVLTDGDGTRHVFKRRPDTGTSARFDAPAGVHLELRRFDNDESSARYWAATRPDGSTFFFSRDGRPSEAEDRHGNKMRLTWEERPDYASAPATPGCGYAPACRYRVTEVLDAAAIDATDLTGSNNTPADRKWILRYDTTDPMRLVSVEDRKRLSGPNGTAVRRQTTLAYDAEGRLKGATAAANAPDGAARRTWGLEYVAGSAFLNRVTDPRGSETRIRYTAAQGSTTPLAGLLDPLLGFAASAPETRQVAAVADRESASSDSTESRERVYRYDAPVAAGQRFGMATWVRDARKVSSRYSMDHLGRLTRLIEDLDDPTRTDDGPASGAAHIQQGTAQTWNDGVNAVASVTRGLKGVDAPFDTAEATATEYTWGALGQLAQETEHKGVAGASPGGTDQRTRSWEYRLHNGTVEGVGDGGGEFVYDITKETDRLGKPTTYVYDNDDTGDPRQVNEPGNGEQDFRYNSRGLVIEHSVRQWKGSDNADDSQKKSWAKAAENIPGDVSEKTFATDTFGEFDGNGDARLRVDARGKNWRTGYDAVGNAVLVSDPRAGSLAGTTGSEAALANTDDPASALTGTLRDGARSGGQPYVARYTFDTLDRQVVVATPKRSAATQGGSNAPAADRFVVTATTYDRNDNVTAERDAESQSTLRTFTKTDQISVEQQPAAPQHAEPGPGDPEAWGNGAERAPVTKFGYDENDDLVLRKDPVPTGDEPIGSPGYRKRWTFDRLGRSVLQVEEGNSAAATELKLTSRAYDLRDNVVREIDPRTNGAVDEAVAIANAAAGQGLRYRYTYDAFDRLSRQTENPREGAPAAQTDVNRESRWFYDAEDHQTETLTPRGRDTRRTYDDRGDLVRVSEAFGYVSGPGADGSTDSYATTTINRRVDGRPTEIVSPRGHDEDGAPVDGSSFRTRFKYFDTGELQRRWLPRVEGQYGPSEWQVRYDINDVGDPVAIRDARGKLFENTFVDTGELATTTRPSWWIYDQGAGSIRERKDDDPAPADASRGSGGLPSEPGNGDFGKVQPQPLPDVMPAAGDTSVAYNDRLQPTTVEGQGDEAGKTISQTLDYDRLGRLTRRELPKDPGDAAGTTIELAWQYNVRGLPRAARRLRSSADGNSAVTFWNYDGFDRETKTTEPPSCQGTGCLAPVTTKAYDRNDALTDEVLPAQARTVQGRVGTTTGTRHHTIDRADRRVATDDESGAHTETVYDRDDMAVKRYAPRAFVSDDGQTGPQPNKEQFATNYRHDGAGRVTVETSTVSDPDGLQTLTTRTRYDLEGNPVRVETPGARNSEDAPTAIAARVTSRVYDARGLLWKSTIGAGENRATTITEYDGAGNLRRTVNPKGVEGLGDGATPKYADEGDIGTTGRSAWHATLQTYDADQGLIGRTMAWGDGDGGPSDAGRHRYRQEFERSNRGLVSGISEIFDATGGDAPHTARADTQIERNLAGWPIRSTDRRLTGSTWTTVGDPLKYDYDQLGNQKLWSSVGERRTIQRSFYRSGQLRVKCGRRTAGGDDEQVYSYRYNNGGALSEVVDWMHRSATGQRADCQPQGDDEDTLPIRKTLIQRDRAERPTVVNEDWTGGKDTAIRYFGSVPNLVSSVQTDGEVSGTNGSTYDGGKSSAFSYDQQGRNTQVRVRDDGDLSGTPDRTTDMAWWPSGQRRSTKKPKTSDDKRTVDSRFYNSRGEVVRRRADPASGITKTYAYTYDKNGNRTKDERGTSDYDARDQLTKWVRIRRKADGTAMPAPGTDGYEDPSEVSPDKTTTYTDIDGAGRPHKIEETIEGPQSDIGVVKTTIKTENFYSGDQLAKALRTTKAVPERANVKESASAQTDCFDYDVFGSQTQTHRQTTTAEEEELGNGVALPTPTASCKSDAGAWSGKVENRNVFDTFERQTASRQRSHGKVDESDDGALNGTQAFCYDPLDRRDRRVVGLKGATDPAAAEEEGDGRTRAQTACTTPAAEIGSDVVAYDYGYVGLTEQLSREIRSGREQSYDYTASGERLGRLKGTGSSREWRAYDTDAQGSVVGLEKPATGQTTPDVDPDSGKVTLNTYETDPFGDPVGNESDVSTEAAENPFRFQGFYSDPGTGTYDMQARAYQPSTGRFLQQDRFEDPEADLRLASDPMTSSRYAFTAGNPGTYSEYDGHVPTYTSGDEPKHKHNLDAAARGADSPGRQAERGVYRETIAQQEDYYRRTGRPLKGEGSHIGPLPPLRVARAASGSGGGPSIVSRLAGMFGEAINRPIIAADVYGDGATVRDFAPDPRRIYETYLEPQGCTVLVEAGCYSGHRLGDPGRSSTAEKAIDVSTVFGGAALRSGWSGAGRTIDEVLAKARRYRGDFPEEAGRFETLVRRSPRDGSPTNYQHYGADGWPVQRVDLVGRPHDGVPTPHVLDFTRHTNPKSGEVFVRKNRHVREANENEIPKR